MWAAPQSTLTLEVGARRVVIIEIPLGWLSESGGERSEEPMGHLFCFVSEVYF
jgi:hypothetical protein